jgi:hypothetical protein
MFNLALCHHMKGTSNEDKALPGDWRKSELIKRITSENPDLHMPPIKMNKQLSDQEVAMLKKWIQQGAKWEPYWVFVPPKKSEPPSVKQKKEAANDIDRFILKELENHNLKPAALAEKTALLGRLSYLITGLPPSPEEVAAFMEYESSGAYKKQVDCLLASPHFGERWARHWMYFMRYSESRGHEFDFPVIGAWHYHEYLIRAYNANVPYDQFICEHLAGDMLTEPCYHPKVAGPLDGKGLESNILRITVGADNVDDKGTDEQNSADGDQYHAELLHQTIERRPVNTKQPGHFGSLASSPLKNPAHVLGRCDIQGSMQLKGRLQRAPGSPLCAGVNHLCTCSAVAPSRAVCSSRGACNGLPGACCALGLIIRSSSSICAPRASTTACLSVFPSSPTLPGHA